MGLESKLIELVDDKANQDDGDYCLEYVTASIYKLKQYLSGHVDLSRSEINFILCKLVEHLTITLDIPISNIGLIRARKVDQPPLLYYYGNISELSYMVNPTSTLPRLGRLNCVGNSIFYASINNTSCDKSLRVTLSEIEANDGDKVNVLNSVVKQGCFLNVRYIGIWDYVINNRKPYFLPQDVFDYYVATHDYMIKMFSKNQLLAYDLCDVFFADVLSRKGSERLYNVTSILSKCFLGGGTADAIIYTSVKVHGEPVIAISPASVDAKIEHTHAEALAIHNNYGYSHYEYARTHFSKINKTTLKFTEI